jgi:hypothetical protein
VSALQRVMPPYAGPGMPHLIEHYDAVTEHRLAGTSAIGARTPAGVPTAWELHLPWSSNPIPMNGSHGHWSSSRKKVAGVRDTARALTYRPARQPLPGLPTTGIRRLEHVHARLVWEVVDRTHRDEDNLGRTAKALVDGLRDLRMPGTNHVALGIIEDDTPDYITRHHARIRYEKRSPERPAAFMRLRLWIPGAEEPGVPL